jgi:hypothetical protein
MLGDLALSNHRKTGYTDTFSYGIRENKILSIFFASILYVEYKGIYTADTIK